MALRKKASKRSAKKIKGKRPTAKHGMASSKKAARKIGKKLTASKDTKRIKRKKMGGGLDSVRAPMGPRGGGDGEGD